MISIFTEVFTDISFLSAFFQTIIGIFLGFFLYRIKIFKDDAKKVITTLVWKITVPCVAFNAFMQDFNIQSFKTGLFELVMAVILYTLFIFLGKLLFIKKSKDFSTVASLFFAVGQTTLFSMPVLLSVYEKQQQEVMLYISTVTIIFRIVVYIISFYLISGERPHIKTLGPSLKKIFLTPIMIGMFGGMFIYLIQNYTFQVQTSTGFYSFLRIDKTLPFLYPAVLSFTKLLNPLCMLLIGISVGQSKLSDVFKDPMAWLTALLRNLIAPALTCLICFIIGKTGLVSFTEISLVTIVICFSAPVSVTLGMMCIEHQKEEVFATRACVLSTILTLVSFPFCFVMAHLTLQLL